VNLAAAPQGGQTVGARVTCAEMKTCQGDTLHRGDGEKFSLTLRGEKINGSLHRKGIEELGGQISNLRKRDQSSGQNKVGQSRMNFVEKETSSGDTGTTGHHSLKFSKSRNRGGKASGKKKTEPEPGSLLTMKLVGKSRRGGEETALTQIVGGGVVTK